MTMTIRDIKAIALDKWNHYYSWKMYPKWSRCLGAGLGLLLASLAIAIVIGVIRSSPSTDIPIMYINQVNITEPGRYTINRYSDGHMIIDQNSKLGKDAMIPYTNEPIPDPQDVTLLNLLWGFFLPTLLAGVFLALLYVYRYVDDRNEYAVQQTQLWVDSISKNLPAVLPTEESVVEFAKHI